jgi:hypothetical protein
MKEKTCAQSYGRTSPQIYFYEAHGIFASFLHSCLFIGLYSLGPLYQNDLAQFSGGSKSPPSFSREYKPAALDRVLLSECNIEEEVGIALESLLDFNGDSRILRDYKDVVRVEGDLNAMCKVWCDSF